MVYFVVIFEQGPAWRPGRSMREQEQWAEHAAFMNALTAEGFVVLGGPIHGGPTHRARLIVRAESEPAMRVRLADDPWMRTGHLKILSVEPWEVLLRKDD
jgi:uncharacterized protein YciI